MTTMSILVLAGIVWLVWELRHAPHGYQDKTGFHKGEEQ